MSKENNLTDFLTDVADAIREKKGTAEKINPQNFSDEIKGIKTSSIYTGHVDVEGLKAIGWDDEDIAYFQEHGVNWDEEDDEYYKVSDDNKALYGVLTADNIQEYKNRIVWLPKIDLSKRTSANALFSGFSGMLAAPTLDLTKFSDLGSLFNKCSSLIIAPKLIIYNKCRFQSAFHQCESLIYYHKNTFSEGFNGVNNYIFYNTKITHVPYIEHVFTSAEYVFSGCTSLKDIDGIELPNSSTNGLFTRCFNLRKVFIRKLSTSISFNNCPNIYKESLLYIINNEAATEAITITLHAYVYARLATDPDIVAALAEHPLISLASA